MIMLGLLSAAQVREIAAGLQALHVDTLRFDPDALSEEEIYPGTWADDDAEIYFRPNLRALTAFYRDAAAQNQAVLLAIT